jgi:ornithine decarboxylase
MKANPDLAVVETIAASSLGFEVSSEDELALLTGLGVSPNRIISSNPIKTPGFIEAMHALGRREFVFDSTTEAEKLARLAPGSDAVIRLTVDNLESSWPLADKFGVGPDDAHDLLLYAAKLGLVPSGITFHVGSQCLGLASWRGALQRAAGVWARLADSGVRLRTLNVGGGFPAQHDEGIPTVPDTFDLIFGLVSDLFPSGVELRAEPGRGLVADAGVLVSSVIGKAVREEASWVYLDVGVFNGLMESIGGINYLFAPLAARGPEQRWTVAGPSCDSFDVIAKDVSLPDLEVGDRVLIHPAGAYTTAYAAPFNGAVVPPVVLG